MNALNLPDNKDRKVLVLNQENPLQEVIPEVVDLIQEVLLPAVAALPMIVAEVQDLPEVLQDRQVEVPEVAAGLLQAGAQGQAAEDKI
jgi:hypothetical protein